MPRRPGREERQQRIFHDLDRLIAADPSLDNIKLKGGEGYRLRVGSYRVLYDVDKPNRVFIVFRIADRKDVY